MPYGSPHLRVIVEDAVKAFDNAWLLPPQQGEVFETAKACLRRLPGCALSRGFALTLCINRTRERQPTNHLPEHVGIRVFASRDCVPWCRFG